MSWEETVKLHEADTAATELIEFSNQIAFEIGVAARQLLIDDFSDRPVVINITLALGQVLFHAVTPAKGLTLDSDLWISRKVMTVMRFGILSLLMGLMLKKRGRSIEESHFCLEVDYATHGGAVPIKIRGFDGSVGVLSISGLSPEDDHRVAILTLIALRQQQEKDEAKRDA